MRASHIPHVFIDFRHHTIKDYSWGQPIEDMPWRFEDGYMLWYVRVSHPQILPPIPGSSLSTVNEERLV